MKGIYWLGLGIVSLQAFFINPCFAQSSNIVPDNSLGAESSRVIENSQFQGLPVEVIRGGARRGINLFHSFREFNISEGRGAYFSSPDAEIQNILARVTGSNRSDILGTLGTLGDSQGNLFLINPNGIVFGENASLDVGGSFVATTANGMQFGERGFFSATSPQSPSQLLTINPSALFFNQINKSAEIRNSSIAPAGISPAGFRLFGLSVPDGKSLLLLGGNVILDGGQLNAPGGRVELGGLMETGTVELSVNRDIFNLIFPEGVERGDISLTNRTSRVDTLADNGGSIAVNAKNVDISEGSVIITGIEQGLGTVDSQAGNITLNATGEISITDSRSGIFNFVQTNAKGNGGNINVDAASLKLRDDATLQVSTFGKGDVGNITVTAKNVISLTGNAGIFSTVESGSVGKGGNININAASLSLRDGSQILANTFGASSTQSAAKGDAGNVNVKVSGVVNIIGKRNRFRSGILSQVGTDAEGNGGNITINAGSFNLREGGLSVSTRGKGNAGNVMITAKDGVSLTSGSIFSTVEAGGVGKGGNIDINATSLSLQNGAQLLAITRGISNTQKVGKGDAGNVNVKVSGVVDITGRKDILRSGIFSTVGTGTEGNGGNIIIDAGSLKLGEGARISASTRGKGNAGNVVVSAKDAISLTGNTGILSTVEGGGVGKGGNIDINARTLTLRDGAQLLTINRGASDNPLAGRGDAGDVNLKVKGIVDIAGVRGLLASGIRSNLGIGTEGDGGNININAGSFKLQDGAQLAASTFGQGDAGNVTVTTKGIASFRGSTILTTVEAGGIGKGGNVNINSTTLSLQDGAQLLTVTRGASDTQPPGKGDAGDVNVKVTGIVDIAGNGFNTAIVTRVETDVKGNAGNINIDTGSFKLRDGARLSASTRGQGNAGNVKVTAKDTASLVGASILSTVEAGGVGKGGNIDISATKLSLTDGAQLLTATRAASSTQPAGRGNAGNVNVKVFEEVDIAGVKNGGSSAILSRVNIGTEGDGGNIIIDAGSLKLRDGALLDARTENNNKGGDITINANVFETLNGGQITTTTSSNGRAGKITVNATDKVIISGSDPNFNGRVNNFPNRLGNIDANSGFFVSSTGSGTTGDIFVTSPKITLDNSGRINAESASVNGGNINLTVTDLLLMRRGAKISTNAGTAQQGGNGGNININSKFIVAVPKEDNDITANAFSGTGGNVEIISQGIFGIEPRQQANETTNDITASSDLGVPGNINLNSPDTSSIQNSLDDLPDNQIDTNALIANSCIARSNQRQENSFTITGSGGLRNSPGDRLISIYSTGDVRNVETTPRPWKKGDPIIEATGVYKLPDGRLFLSRKCS